MTKRTRLLHRERLDAVPASAVCSILRNSDLAALVRHMDMLDEELMQIDDQKAAWKDTVGGDSAHIATDRQRYEKRQGSSSYVSWPINTRR